MTKPKFHRVAQPCDMTACQAIEAIRTGALSATELIQSCIARIKDREPTLHAWTFFDPDRAITQARVIDQKLSDGNPPCLLSGIPIGIKDVLNTFDMPTSMGSPIWKNFTPGNDSRVVAALRGKGGVIIGKTVTAEFAVHHPGPTVNPYNPDYSPGTSSSGSAAAVATRMIPLALGTQTAGSTIRPASYCGIYGFKPSFGVIPRTGILKTLDSLDHVAFLARDPNDLELIFECSRVRGPNHPYVHQELDQWPCGQLDLPIRIALVRGPVWDQAEDYAQKALLQLADEWRRVPELVVEDVNLPDVFRDVHDLHKMIYSKALSYYFKKEYDEYRQDLSVPFRNLVEEGMRVAPDTYRDGLKKQQILRRTLDEFFKDYDFILTLSTAGAAPLLYDGTEKEDSCLIWTLCHVPAINLPLFQNSSGLPFGAQLVTSRYKDRALIDVVKRLKAKQLIREWDHSDPCE